MQDDKALLNLFQRLGITLPSHEDHGITPEQLKEKMTRVQTSNWRLEGTLLTCDTDQGPMGQHIEPGYICKGTDENGLPILEKIALDK